MDSLVWYQYVLIGAVFAWSGFVRTGLGFGGALFTLPFLLLIDNRPIVYLALIAIQLLFFASLTLMQNHWKARRQSADTMNRGVDWRYLRKAMAIILIPKLIGVFGLLNLPSQIMSIIIFCVVMVYAFSYIISRPFKSRHRALDWLFLILGGYISGTSLIGAPLIVAVVASHVDKYRLRDTLFALWIILVTIKTSVFIYTGVDLHLEAQLWLLPCAAIGHVIGLKVHEKLLKMDTGMFYQVIGSVLFLTSIAGLIQSLA